MKQLEKRPSRQLTLSLCGYVSTVLIAGLAGGYSLAARPDTPLALLFLTVAAAAGVQAVRRIANALRWHEDILDGIPAPVAVVGPDCTPVLENQTALERLNATHYQTLNGLFYIPEGHVLSGAKLMDVTVGGREYRTTIRPVRAGQPDEGYVLSYTGVADIVENQVSRAALIQDANRLIDTLGQVSGAFNQGVFSLARCTRRHAEAMAQMVDVIHSVSEGQAVTEEQLDMLAEVALSLQHCTASGEAYSSQIAKTARSIVQASHSVANTVKAIHNIV